MGDAPQTQVSGRINLTPISDLGIIGVLKYFDNHYAALDPENRNNKTRDDAYKLDSFSLLNLHAVYYIQWHYTDINQPCFLPLCFINPFGPLKVALSLRATGNTK